LGKTGHFRKHGIAVPQAVFIEDLQRLVEQLIHFKAKKIIAVGDLFHSKANKEMDLFLKWRNDLPGLEFILVRGNHDILQKEWYENAGIQVKEGVYAVRDFSFLHDPSEVPEETLMIILFFRAIYIPVSISRGLRNRTLHSPVIILQIRWRSFLLSASSAGWQW
jgi:metallophosphoesterase superfamily enzyme